MFTLSLVLRLGRRCSDGGVAGPWLIRDSSSATPVVSVVRDSTCARGGFSADPRRPCARGASTHDTPPRDATAVLRTHTRHTRHTTDSSSPRCALSSRATGTAQRPSVVAVVWSSCVFGFYRGDDGGVGRQKVKEATRRPGPLCNWLERRRRSARISRDVRCRPGEAGKAQVSEASEWPAAARARTPGRGRKATAPETQCFFS